jgi:phage gp16-like protein
MCRINRKITDEGKSRIAKKNWRVTSNMPSFMSEICGWLVNWLIGRKLRESDVIKTDFVNPMARFDANE